MSSSAYGRSCTSDLQQSAAISETGLKIQRLRAWADLNHNTYPWREQTDPWSVLVAESLLRRTRAEQVAHLLPVVLKRFPTPTDLAEASENEAQSVFSSAGLATRTAQLQEASKQIVSHHSGVVPTAYEELIELPGVGPYVAAAVSGQLSREGVVLVDTNTVRVVTRVVGIRPKTKEARREKAVVRAIESFFGGPAQIDDWWALIDLAHNICRPVVPACKECPLCSSCEMGKLTAESAVLS